MNWQDQLRYRYNMAGAVEKLIAVNVLFFVVFNIILGLISFFCQCGIQGSIRSWLIFPERLDEFIFKPWTIITYAFMHAGFWHILWNMVVLYFAGRFFLTFFSAKRLLNYYFMGAIAGAILFMLAYNLFPVFKNSHSFLLGASAAVMAILVGVAAQSPNMNVRFFIFNLKLWWIAAFFVGKDLLMIPLENPGGHIAHLGGAALGFVYTTQLAKGHDIGSGFEKLMDRVVGWFSGSGSNPFKKVYKNKHKQAGPRGPYQSKQSEKGRDRDQEKIDAILDKISKNGYESLSEAEKEYLFHAGKD